MPPKLFMDANILFTAAISPDGQARALFDLGAKGHCRLFASRFAMEEARRNLQVKYQREVGQLDALLAGVVLVREADRALVQWAREHVVAKDVPILAAAVVSEAEYLVTSDKRHFGHLFGVSVRSVEVIYLNRALEVVLGSGP